MSENTLILDRDDPVLITGSNGFIGASVVKALLSYGFSNLRCFVRPSSNLTRLQTLFATFPKARVEVMPGNLLSREDCEEAAKNSAVIFHLAAGIEKTFPGSFMNSVVTTRNLLDAAVCGGGLQRFVNVSSFAVYSNWHLRRGALLNETCELESQLVDRAEAYAFAKRKQDELVLEYAQKYAMPYVILRPGAVYGPGSSQITGRVGLNTFGIFLHLGGANQLPLTYVDNCADAIVLAGITRGVDSEVFNIVDDELPTSRQFLRLYKKHARHFRSVYVPYRAFYFFCFLWEKYSAWSEGQLPPAFNRRRCSAYWKGNTYSNKKLKELLGWQPRVPFAEASRQYFAYIRQTGLAHA
ncbi:MAG TPA: NAD(P)-dependent oxidoreductase [Candidatus Tectomicrobia bacterium]